MKRWAKRLAAVAIALAVGAGGASLWWEKRQDRQRQELETARAQVEALKPRQVEYRLTGTATGADLTYRDGRGQTTQAMGKAVPLVKKDGGLSYIGFKASSGSFLYFSAQNTGSTGDLTCEIVVDGVVVAENTSDGGYAIVTCEAEV